MFVVLKVLLHLTTTVTNVETNSHNEDIENLLSLSLEKLINTQTDETICKAIIKLINEK